MHDALSKTMERWSPTTPAPDPPALRELTSPPEEPNDMDNGDTPGPTPAPTNLVPPSDFDSARERITATCRRTPVLEVTLPADAGSVWVKAESLQHTGSFKLRGAANTLAMLGAAERAGGVVTYSAGNHGRALAYAARLAGIRATVVMPQTAAQFKIDATRALGASVALVPADELVAHAHQLARTERLTLVPPFDDPRVIAGQGTVGLELLEQVHDIDLVLVPVGGGGLIAGVAAAVKDRRPEVRVVAVEPELAADLAEGYAAGTRTDWPRELTGRTIADGLRSPAVGELTWAHITSLVDDVVTVSEASIIDAMRWLAETGKLVVEPSGAVAAAAILQDPDVSRGGNTVVIATGGNIDIDTFGALLAGTTAAR
jgi:threonine dehydratase